MLDPLTSVSLANAIVQFIDFGYKTVRGSLEIYQSSQGALSSNLDLERTVEDVSRLNSKIAPTIYDGSASVLSEDERELRELAKSCRKIADDLLTVLRDLKATKPSTRNQKWASFRAAVASQTPWNKEKILNLENKLHRSQEQISRRLLLMMSQEQSRTRSIIDHLAHDGIDELRADIIKSIKSANGHLLEDQLEDISAKMQVMVRTVEQKRIDRIIGSLDPGITKSREISIAEPQKSTFEWVFDDVEAPRKSSNFRSWLRSDSDIYWVSGASGSGKSTLMRHLIRDPRTTQDLHRWAGQSRLYVASFFAWYTGDDLQKSAQGLIQSLLYDMFTQNPAFVKSACPNRISQTGRLAHKWSWKDAIEAFERLTVDTVDAKFCFFVDGIDEFGEDLHDIVDVLKSFAKKTTVKLCFSSRPWTIFLKSFVKTERLVVEENNKSDIESYVNAILRQDESYVQLAQTDPQVQDFPKDVVEMSQGVFLWVRLIATELRYGLGNADNVAELRRRLFQLPRSLEAFYERAFDRIDPFYEQETAQILQMMIATEESLPLAMIVFYELEKRPSDRPSARMRQYEPSEVDAVFQSCQSRLTSRCQDFVIVRPQADGQQESCTVSLLHQTVATFLITPDVRDKLATAAGPMFNAKRCLIQVTLAQIKYQINRSTAEGIFEGHKGDYRKEPLLKLTERLVRYLREAEQKDGATNPLLLEDLDKTLQSYVLILEPGCQHWSTSVFFKHTGIAEALESGSKKSSLPSLLNFAIQENLQLYVAWKLQQDPHLLTRSLDPPLLWYAFRKAKWLQPDSKEDASNTDMISVLIQQGAKPSDTVSCDPTEYGMTISVSELFFRKLYKQNGKATGSQYVGAKLLLQSPDSYLWPSRYIRVGNSIDLHHQRIPLLQIVRSAFRPDEAAELHEIIMQYPYAKAHGWWVKSLFGRILATIYFLIGDTVRIHNRFPMWVLKSIILYFKEFGRYIPTCSRDQSEIPLNIEWVMDSVSAVTFFGSIYLILESLSVLGFFSTYRATIWPTVISFVPYCVFMQSTKTMCDETHHCHDYGNWYDGWPPHLIATPISIGIALSAMTWLGIVGSLSYFLCSMMVIHYTSDSWTVRRWDPLTLQRRQEQISILSLPCVFWFDIFPKFLAKCFPWTILKPCRCELCVRERASSG